MDDLGAVETQVAELTQFLAQLQDEVFEVGVGALRVVRRVRPIGPIDAIEALALGTANPQQHGGGADAESCGHATQRTPPANGGYHVTTPVRLAVVLLMRTSRWWIRFTSTVAHTVQHLLALNCSASTGIWPFTRSPAGDGAPLIGRRRTAPG